MAKQPKFGHTQVMAPPIKTGAHSQIGVTPPFGGTIGVKPKAPGTLGIMPKTGKGKK